MELMKEKFARLLLGEDMSGGGKGVSSALALSNAITNLAGISIKSYHRLCMLSRVPLYMAFTLFCLSLCNFLKMQLLPLGNRRD